MLDRSKLERPAHGGPVDEERGWRNRPCASARRRHHQPPESTRAVSFPEAAKGHVERRAERHDRAGRVGNDRDLAGGPHPQLLEGGVLREDGAGLSGEERPASKKSAFSMRREISGAAVCRAQRSRDTRRQSQPPAATAASVAAATATRALRESRNRLGASDASRAFISVRVLRSSGVAPGGLLLEQTADEELEPGRHRSCRSAPAAACAGSRLRSPRRSSP